MTSITESAVEQANLEWLEELGYERRQALNTILEYL